MLFDSVDWTTVLQTLIITLPAIIAAAFSVSVHQKIKTPSGTPIGRQVEDTQHVALANHYALNADARARGERGATAIEHGATPAEAATESA